MRSSDPILSPDEPLLTRERVVSLVFAGVFVLSWLGAGMRLSLPPFLGLAFSLSCIWFHEIFAGVLAFMPNQTVPSLFIRGFGWLLLGSATLLAVAAAIT